MATPISSSNCMYLAYECCAMRALSSSAQNCRLSIEADLPDEPLPTRTEAEGATVDLPEGMGFFTVGQVLDAEEPGATGDLGDVFDALQTTGDRI